MGTIKKNGAQTMMEYLILLALVAFLVITAMKPQGPLDAIHNATAEHYNAAASVIASGTYNAQSRTYSDIDAKIEPVNGGWCGWSTCIDGYQKFRECACPRPAFGGQGCSGSAIMDCNEGYQFDFKDPRAPVAGKEEPLP
jgi:hypothetical protein